MEKLLQLLNEYLLQTNIVVIEQEIEGRRDIFFENEDGFHAEEAEIISKKFGFIQWFVDTEQFDYWKVGDIVNKCQGSLREKAYVTSDCPYESMLMLLAIQDDPISFLVSILK